jgi:diguanylate cyclase (GGDEF)-like protein
MADAKVRAGTVLRYETEDGFERIFSVNSAPIGGDGSRRGALVTLRDVTHVETQREELEKMLSMLRSSRDEVRRKNRELEILATQDALTGCVNRRAFFERFEAHWDEATRDGAPLACIMIDQDYFKSVNDHYGHHVGDEVLRRVAHVIRELHPTPNLVCRYGGEEFCVLLPGADLRRAVEEAERTREAISAIRFDQPSDLRISASFGVSDLSFAAGGPQELINQADAGLYVAKRRGRDQVVVYDPKLPDVDTRSPTPPSREEAEEVAIPFQAVTALLSALAYRDVDTAEHSRRVADLCVLAADGILDHRQTYVLEIAALLHDIGKIGVPDHVLLKPGTLTAEEWKLMRQHDRIGVEIIAGTFRCEELSEMIRMHHALYGGGNDNGLPRGEEIPVGARLLTIADSYDAMVSDRVYRKGRSHAEAVEELRRCAGTQFDPRLVEHFVQRVAQRAESRAVASSIVTKQTAMQIGMQIERLADAIDRQDTEGLQTLAARLGLVAERHEIKPIAEAAHRIEQQSASEDFRWIELLRETQQLMELCRATQNAYVGDAVKRESLVTTA